MRRPAARLSAALFDGVARVIGERVAVWLSLVEAPALGPGARVLLFPGQPVPNTISSSSSVGTSGSSGTLAAAAPAVQRTRRSSISADPAALTEALDMSLRRASVAMAAALHIDADELQED